MLKFRSTTLNMPALLYKRFIGLEKSVNLNVVYLTISTNEYRTFDYTTLSFSVVDSSNINLNGTIKQIKDNVDVLQYQTNYFIFDGKSWTKTNKLPQNMTLLSVSFNNIGKYQTNRYYYVGSFDYMIKGNIEGSTTQFLKGNIVPLKSLNIKFYADININTDDLVVLENNLFMVENTNTIQKRMPKPFLIHTATLNSII